MAKINKPQDENSVDEITEKVDENKAVVNDSFIRLIPPFNSPNSKTFISLNGNEFEITIDADNNGLIPQGHTYRQEIQALLESEKWKVK